MSLINMLEIIIFFISESFAIIISYRIMQNIQWKKKLHAYHTHAETRARTGTWIRPRSTGICSSIINLKG